jgi:chloramphenicol-sensitive protein RarD
VTPASDNKCSELGAFGQYIAPTLQLLAGVLLLDEAFTGTQAIGLGCIWVGLAVYAADGWRRARAQPATVAAEHCATEVPPCDGAAPPKGS